MQKEISGECNCGGVTYKIKNPPLLTYVCHCGNCQKRSGSAFGMGMVLPVDDIEIEGELACWERVSDAGNRNPVYRCAVCGNVIYGLGAYTPGLAKIMPGTLRNTCDIRPDVHVWVRDAQRWVNIPADVLQYQGQPDNFVEVLEIAAANRLQRTNVP
tara:strand:+ start:91 stop:561 length:471 start_codon:yes stop_codon:yes gene_type:complete